MMMSCNVIIRAHGKKSLAKVKYRYCNFLYNIYSRYFIKHDINNIAVGFFYKLDIKIICTYFFIAIIIYRQENFLIGH